MDSFFSIIHVENNVECSSRCLKLEAEVNFFATIRGNNLQIIH